MTRQVAVFFFCFVAHPSPDSADFQKAGGAYVSCWIDASTPDDAEARARRCVEEACWRIECVEQRLVVTREDYPPEDPTLRYFEQATIDGEVLVFHRWPPEPQEDDTVH